MAALRSGMREGHQSTRPPWAALLPAWAGCAALACASTPAPLPPSSQVAAPAVPAEDVRVRLVFGEEADLDLFVVDPDHEEIYFGNTVSRLGGRFDEDRRCGDPAPRVETVRFTPAPPGRYRVSVDFPMRCRAGVDAVPYRVVVDANGQRQEREGTLEFGRLEHIVLEFDATAARRSP